MDDDLRNQMADIEPEVISDGSDGGPILVRYSGNETISTVTKASDPATILLNVGYRSTPTVYQSGCYICEDPEFAHMGLPLCKPCPRFRLHGNRHGVHDPGHVPADDVECTACGFDVQLLWAGGQPLSPEEREKYGIQVRMAEAKFFEDLLFCKETNC